MSKDEKTKTRDHGPVFRMEAVWYPTTNPEVDFLVKFNGDAEAWAKSLDARLDATLFKPFCKLWVWQLEKGEVGGKYHCQIYFELWEKTRCPTLAGQIGSAEHLPGITIREASIAGKNAIRYYCSKDKTRVAGPFSNQPLQMVTAPSEWDLKEIESAPYPWQRDMIALMKKKCSDDRKIHWVYDPQGCSGKTKLIKFLCAKKLAIPVQYGPARDLMNVIYNNKGSNAYVFDLTRAKPGSMPGDDIYSVMEAAKNGMVQNTKYETGWAVFDPPHMVVFANVKPEFKKLTMDRWQVWCIDDAANLTRWDKEGDTPKVKARRMTVANVGSQVDDEQVPPPAAAAASSSAAAAPPPPPAPAKKPKGKKNPISRFLDLEAGDDEDDEDDTLAVMAAIRNYDKEVAMDEKHGRHAARRTVVDRLEKEAVMIKEAERKRKEWNEYWDAVRSKWKRTMGYDGDLRGTSCMHNLWGCNECDQFTCDEQKFYPPSLF